MDITLASWGPASRDIRDILHSFSLSQEGIFLEGTILHTSNTVVETSFLADPERGVYLQFFGVEPTNSELIQLIFTLTDQAGLLLTVAPGPPHIITTPAGPKVEDITDANAPPWLEVVCVVDKPTDLARALNDEWKQYRSTYADKWWHMPDGF